MRDGCSVALRTPGAAFPGRSVVPLKRNPTVATFDLGTSCGWSLHVEGRRLAHGVVSFTPPKHKGPGFRFLMFKRFLVNLKAQAGGEIDYLLYEEVSQISQKARGNTAAVMWGGFAGILTYWCEHHGIWYRGVHNQTLKASVGSGRFDKAQMVAAVEKFFGIDLHGRHDEADALALQIHFHKKIWPELRKDG